MHHQQLKNENFLRHCTQRVRECTTMSQLYKLLNQAHSGKFVENSSSFYKFHVKLRHKNNKKSSFHRYYTNYFKLWSSLISSLIFLFWNEKIIHEMRRFFMLINQVNIALQVEIFIIKYYCAMRKGTSSFTLLFSKHHHHHHHHDQMMNDPNYAIAIQSKIRREKK